MKTRRKAPGTAWKAGQSGNPKGRPKGSRNKFAEQFLKDFMTDWEDHGAEAIKAVRADDPATYVRVAASILPKEIEQTIRTVSANELPDDELAMIATTEPEQSESVH